MVCRISECGYLSLLSAFERDVARFFLDCVHPHSQPHCSRASGLLCPRVLTAEQMALLTG